MRCALGSCYHISCCKFYSEVKSIANRCINIALRPDWDTYVEYDGKDPAIRARLKAAARGRGHLTSDNFTQQASKSSACIWALR